MRALLDLLDDDTTLITVNRRLARTVIEAHAVRRIAAGDRTWRTPDVIPYAAWAERTWRSCARHDSGSRESFLRSYQERMLWEQVVRQHAPPDDDAQAPLAAGAAARRAQDAYALAMAWNISLDALEFGFSAEFRAFRAWARAFDAACADAGWINAVRAGNALTNCERLKATKPRRRAVFAGFDAMTPQQQAIRAALAQCGVEVIDPEPARGEARVSHRAFDDPVRELRAAAAWARRRLCEAPARRIGIVVPELHRMRPAVERIFEEQLVPGAAMPGWRGVERPFNVSYGEPLSRLSVVGDALIALKLSERRVELAEAGRLLRSPYILGGGRRLSARALADRDLRDAGQPEVGLDRLAVRSVGDDTLRRGIGSLMALRRGVPRRQPLRLWSAFFSDWLSRLGWPGERPLDSDEFQAVEAFRGLLDELAGIGAVLGPVGLDRALSLLLKLADEHLFQPRSGPVRLQILGVLESAGLDFDELWISGLHDASWPPAPEPDPFVPVSLQRGAGVPTASPEGQLNLARRRLEAWLRAADEVVLSYPRFRQDEPLHPSPFIGQVSSREVTADDDASSVAFSEHLNRHGASLETVIDERGPALTETRITRGGAGVLRDQAACPFRAFARWRLDARGVPVAASPLDARIRGDLVHAVLRDLWSEIRSQARLNALSPDELKQRVSVAAEQALERERRQRPDTLRGNFARIEHRRLCSLIEAWLELEKDRAPFEVAEREKDIETSVGPLSLCIRPDRVDRLPSGEHVVIDYKTGAPEVRHWFGERPEDPQLAVYTLAVESGGSGGTVAGAAYGVLRRGALGFKGLADREGLAEGVTTLAQSKVVASRELSDWPGLKSDWRRTLRSLAASFASGNAEVDPRSRHTTCTHCDVMPFCRIFDRPLDADDEGTS